MEDNLDLIKMARAAERDDRLSDGALYGKLAMALESSASDLVLAIAERAAAEEVSRTSKLYVAAMEKRLSASDDWPDWFPASPADVERGEELFVGGYTWTLRGDDGPKHYRYCEGRWQKAMDEKE